MRNRVAVLVLSALLVCSTAAAQEYGQWSWRATLGAGLRSWENALNGSRSGELEQRDLRLFFGVNGFILHPSVAEFFAGIDTSFTDSQSQPSTDSTSTGYRVSLSLLPAGAVPVHLYGARQQFGWGADRENAAPGFALPRHGTSYGGRLRLRGGVLRGLEAAVDRSTIAMTGSADDDVSSRESIDWSRGSRRIQQHYRVERQLRAYAGSDYEIDDLLARAEQQGSFGRWRWNAFGNLLQRDFTAAAGTAELTAGRIASMLTSENGTDPSWTFLARSETTGGSGSSLNAHSIEARHLRPRWNGVQWSASAGYALQTAGDLRLHAPSASLGANWAGTAGAFGLSASGSAGVLSLTSSGGRPAPSGASASYSGGFTVSHAGGGRLRESLEGSLSRNRLRTSFLIEGEPGFGAIGSAGTEDARQVRFTVAGRAAALDASAWSDWSERESNFPVGGARFETSTLTQTFQVSSRRLSVSATAGETEVATDRVQRIEFAGASVSARPFQPVSFTTTYRRDRRTARFEPRIDGERLEAGASIRLGAIWLNPLAFRMTEHYGGGDERSYEGFTISLSRQMGGYLPIVTAPRRRGTIR
jgi:hypothetical protein